MIENLLKELEAAVSSDDFEYESEEIMERLEEEGVGFEIVEQLLAVMERHPLEDFGMPGAMVHFIERFYPDFLPLLIRSVQRAPSLSTVWMLNRCINGGQQKEELLAALKAVAANDSIAPAIRESARSFLAYQAG